jgi:hypothetical protein
MSQLRRNMGVVVVAVALVAAACGGSSDSSQNTPTTQSQDGQTDEQTSGSTTSAPKSDSGQSDGTTSTAESGETSGGSGTSDSDHPRADVSHATVTVGDEVFYFAQVDENGNFDDNGDCDPEFLGLQFRAILRRVDEQGKNVLMGDTGDLVGYQGVSVGFTDAGPDEWFIAMTGSWQAWSVAGNGTVDSVTIDGNKASGTATFVDVEGDGQPTGGTFEVVCVGG